MRNYCIIPADKTKDTLNNNLKSEASYDSRSTIWKRTRMMLKRKNIRTKNAAADTAMMSMTTASMEMNMDIRTVTDAPAAHTETMAKRKKASI